jgi:hypothetical protein
VRRGVDDTVAHAAAGPLSDEPGAAVGADPRQPHVLPLLEPQACLRAQAVALTRAADGHGVEDRRFNDDGMRCVRHLGPGAAQDACDRKRFCRVRDQQRVRVERPLDVVERLEPLGRSRETDDEIGDAVSIASNGGGVERVDRFAELEHHVVRGVDDVADRPHPGRKQADLNVVRRRGDAHIVDPAPHEARAQVRRFDADAQTFGNRRPGLRRISGWPAHLGARRGGDLARQPDEAQRIATIRLYVDVEHDVAVQLTQRLPERRIGRQDQDAVGVAREVQLVAGAEHPVRDRTHLLGALDATTAGQYRARQRNRDALTDGDIGGATDDLERFPGADRDRGQ